MRHGAVVMASGLSVRYSNVEDKLLATYKNKPLIAHALLAIPDEVEKVVLVTRSIELADCMLKAVPRIIPIVHNLPNLSDTIRLGIEQMINYDTCTFLVSDQPLISSATIVKLLRRSESEPDSIIRTRYEGIAGNPVLFPASTFEELRSLNACDSGRAIIRRYQDTVRYIEADNALEMLDIDSKEDYEYLIRLEKEAL